MASVEVGGAAFDLIDSDGTWMQAIVAAGRTVGLFATSQDGTGWSFDADGDSVVELHVTIDSGGRRLTFATEAGLELLNAFDSVGFGALCSPAAGSGQPMVTGTGGTIDIDCTLRSGPIQSVFPEVLP